MDTCNQNKVVLVVFLLAKTSFTATFTSSYVALALYYTTGIWEFNLARIRILEVRALTSVSLEERKLLSDRG